MEKERRLTVEELKTLHALCGAYVRKNEGVDYRKKNVAKTRKIQHKLFVVLLTCVFKHM